MEVRYLNVFSASRSIESTPADPCCSPGISWSKRFGRGMLSCILVPDASIWFWRLIRKRIESLVEEVAPDVVLTTSPPHSNHDIGLWLSSRTNIPWVADFRDPYLFDPRYRPSGLGRMIAWRHHRYERRIYERAKLILHAIPNHAQWARERYPFAHERIVTLPNGCPPELAEGSVKPDRSSEGRRSVRVVGTCGADEVSSLALAIRSLVEAGGDLELRIVGPRPSNMKTLEAILALRWRRVWRALRTTDAPQRLLLFSLAAMWPIYSWQLFGASHQRLKLPLQIVVYLLVLLSGDAAVREGRDRVPSPQ